MANSKRSDISLSLESRYTVNYHRQQCRSSARLDAFNNNPETFLKISVNDPCKRQKARLLQIQPLQDNAAPISDLFRE